MLRKDSKIQARGFAPLVVAMHCYEHLACSIVLSTPRSHLLQVGLGLLRVPCFIYFDMTLILGFALLSLAGQSKSWSAIASGQVILLVTTLPTPMCLYLPLPPSPLSCVPAPITGLIAFSTRVTPATGSDQFSFVSLLVRAGSCLLPRVPPTSGLLPSRPRQTTSSDHL